LCFGKNIVDVFGILVGEQIVKFAKAVLFLYGGKP